MEDRGIAIHDTGKSFTNGSCSIWKYTEDQFYQYIAMFEMVYVLYQSKELRQQLLHEFSGSTFMLLNNADMADWFADGHESDARQRMRFATVADFFGQNETADQFRETAEQFRETAEHRRDQAERMRAQAKQQFLEALTDLWTKITERFQECGWFYAAATVGVSGVFALGETGLSALSGGAASAALRGLTFATSRLKNGRIRVQVRNTLRDTSYTQDWSPEDLAAKYGKPQDNHEGTTAKRFNREIVDGPAEGMADKNKGERGSDNKKPDERTEQQKLGAENRKTGEMGEDFFQEKYGGRSLQNGSGNGIDNIRDTGDKLIFDEIKTSTKTSPSSFKLQGEQLLGGEDFVNDRLADMANKLGKYKNFSDADAAYAQELLDRIDDGIPIEYNHVKLHRKGDEIIEQGVEDWEADPHGYLRWTEQEARKKKRRADRRAAKKAAEEAKQGNPSTGPPQ